MVDLGKALENLKHDTRMKDWIVKQGLATKQELEQHLNALPDSKNDCEEVTLEDRPDFAD